MTLEKNSRYQVLDRQGGWTKVQFFSSDVSSESAWVESRYLAASRSAGDEQRILQERMNSFDSLERQGRWSAIYAGVTQSGTKVTFIVSDEWNSISRDLKEACVRELFTLFLQLGGAREIREKAEDFRIEVRHQDSRRLVATWDSLFGFSTKD